MIRESQSFPVTGEILPADHARAQPGTADRFADAEDAVFETLGPAPGPSRDAGEQKTADPMRKSAPGDGAANLNVLRGERERPLSGLGNHFRQTGGPVFWGLAVTLVASAFWISGGHALLTGSGAARGALVIADVQARPGDNPAAGFMLIEATVENRGTASHRIPPVIINIEGDNGNSRQFRLPARAGNLAPGAHHLFSGRVPMPKNGVDTVSVKLGSAEE